MLDKNYLTILNRETLSEKELEMMLDPLTKQVHTAHTTLPVPLFLVSSDNRFDLEKNGKLADIAPTILDILSIKKPNQMTGNSLLIKE